MVEMLSRIGHVAEREKERKMLKQKDIKAKGEKYIYLLMAYKLARANNNSILIGKDNGYVDGHNYFRHFQITEFENRVILTEKKNGKNFADYSRYFEIINANDEKPNIYDYINEAGENGGNCWTH